MGRRRLRLCGKCGVKHSKPTGLKCTRQETMGDLGMSEKLDSPPSAGEWSGFASGHDDTEGVKAEAAKAPDSHRLSNLEDLVARMAKVVLKDDPDINRKPKQRSVSPDTTSSSREDSSRSWSPVHSRKGGRKRRDFSRSRHLDKGEEITNFEKLMVISSKTLLELHEQRAPLDGFISHCLTIAEKAATGAYQDRAYIAYDASVRRRAQKMGPKAFDVPVNEDLIRHFRLENSKRFDVNRGGVSSKKKRNTCYCFNAETGCASKDCIYAHRCAICKSESHPAKDCRSGEKGKAK